MKIVARNRRDQNIAAIDPWTLVHFSTGLALGLMNAPPRAALAASVGYEVLEQVLERSAPGRQLFNVKGPERLANVVVDLAVYYIGLRAGKRWLESENRLPGG